MTKIKQCRIAIAHRRIFRNDLSVLMSGSISAQLLSGLIAATAMVPAKEKCIGSNVLVNLIESDAYEE